MPPPAAVFQSRSRRFAEAARSALRNPSRGLLSAVNNQNCWIAVIEVARHSAAISQEAETELKQQAHTNHPDRFTSMYANRINTSQQMLAVPEGRFLVFVRLQDGMRRLSHMMVTLGGGEAAGTNNAPIGGLPVWSSMSIANPAQILPTGGVLNWTGEGIRYDGGFFEVYERPLDQIEGASCTIQ